MLGEPTEKRMKKAFQIEGKSSSMKYNNNPHAIALTGVEKRSRGRDSRSDLVNVQYKPTWNCHNESPIQQLYPNKK
jgi:hypothetical protein